MQWLARLPGTQEIRCSSPGRGMTDFVRQYLCVYVNACIVYIDSYSQRSQLIVSSWSTYCISILIIIRSTRSLFILVLIYSVLHSY